MKKLFACFILGFGILYSASAQYKFYNFTLYAGINPKQTPIQTGLIVNRESPMKEFIFNLSEIEKNYTFGFRTNLQFSYPFFGTMGFEYNRQRYHYSMSFTHSAPEGAKDHVLLTSYENVTLPTGVGVRIGKIEITSGLQMWYNIKSGMKKDMTMDIIMDKPRIEMGWFTGVGLVLDRTRLGIQFQSSMNRYGHDLIHNQKSMELRSIPGNLSFNIGFSF